MYNIFSNKSLKIKKFSFKNLIFFILLIVFVMGFHVWIVVKTLTMLNDVSSVIILKRGKLLTKHLPDVTVHILLRDQDLQVQRHSLDYCPKRNCILVDDKCYPSNDYTMFDAVVHGQTTLKELGTRIRQEKSKVVNIFTSVSPPSDIFCDIDYDNFFHLTFTYRLDSDIVFKYFVVRNFLGDIVAPAIIPSWHANLTSVFEGVKSIITRKSKTVAYLNFCELEDSKKVYLTELEEVLLEYSLKIDTYNCSNDCASDVCGVILPEDYYFFIIIEKSFAEDYVTDRILQAYDNYVVPIIFGGANYSRFLPPHSYIDGRLTDQHDVAVAIHESMNNFTYYEEYFKWRSLYTIERYQPFCDLCNSMNGQPINLSLKKDFRQWWYGEEELQRCLTSPKDNETIVSNAKATTIINTEQEELKTEQSLKM